MDSKAYLRELALKQVEYANSPANQALRDKWYAHNGLEDKCPLIVFEEETFKKELYSLRCEDSDERFIEEQLLQNITAHELINDDKVVPDFFKIPVKIDIKLLGVDRKRTVSKEGLGYHDEPVLIDLEADLSKLSPSTFFYDNEMTQHLEDVASELIGDILPMKRVNETNYWQFAITQHVVALMGMENMFYAMYDYPDKFHELMQFLVDDHKRFLRWQEQNGLLFSNSGNDYMGSGSFCFNRELKQHGNALANETWGHVNSQESVGISAEMYGEFIFPYCEQMAGEFGLLYYGCCEPVDGLRDDYLSRLPNLRKISISAWCDEAAMAEKLKDSRVIYSRKPSPNFIGVDPVLDEDAFLSYMKKTIDLTRDCYTEIIFRDVYTIHHNPDKVKRAVELVRGLL